MSKAAGDDLIGHGLRQRLHRGVIGAVADVHARAHRRQVMRVQDRPFGTLTVIDRLTRR